MTDIKPRIVDGEPVCQNGCPRYNGLDHDCLMSQSEHPCIPALRQQRDEGRRTRCWVESEYGPLPVAVTMNDAIRKRMYDFAVEEYGPAAAARLFPDKETR